MYSPHHPSVASPSSNVNNQQHSHYQQHPGYNTHPGPSYAPYYAPPAQAPQYQAPPAPAHYARAPAHAPMTGYRAAPPPHMQPTSTGAPSPYAYAAPYTYPSHPPQPPPMPNPYSQVQAIPSPTPRVAYQPPVFKTFQERQREREREAHEAALRAAAASAPPAPTPPTRAPITAPHSNVSMGQQGMPNRPQPPPSPRRSHSPSPLPTPQRMPSGSPALPQPPSPRGPAPRGVSGQQAPVLPPAVAAMMGSAGGAWPTPPPRSMVSQPTGVVQQNSRPLPPPRSPSAAPHNLPVAGPITPQPTGSSARSVNSVHSAHAASIRNQPSPHRYSMPNSLPGTALGLNPGIAPPTGPGRSITPQPGNQPMTPQATGSRPLPSPRAMSGPRPAVTAPPGGYSPSPMSSNSPSPVPPPRVPSMGNAPPMPNSTHSGPPRSPLRTTPLLPQSSGAVPAPVNAAVAALLDRSDTVSSVKSLDRAALAGRRELPRPPTGVSASKSLDRGAPAFRAGGPRNPLSRSPVPNIPEQSETTAELAIRMSGVSIGGVVPPRSPSTSPTTPSSAVPGKHRPVPPAVNVPPPAPPSIGMSTGPSTPATPAIITPPTIAIGEGDKTPVPVISIGTPKSPKITLDDGGNCPSSPSIVLSGPPTIAVSSSDTADEDPGSLSIAVPSISVGPAPSAAHTPTRHKSQSLTGPTRIEATSAIVCAGCDNPIIGRIVSAMKQRWHPQCFRCGVCAELLEHVSSYEHEGKPYCHLDYHDRFAHRCHHCHTPIVDSRFITLDDPDLGQRFYHELHFFCSECGDPFLDPSKSSAAGTEFAHNADADADGDGDGETNAFVIHKGHPYCERCHLRLHKPKCCACKQPIPDVAVTALGSKWHAECFVCETCTCPFANNLFFPLNGAAYCTECYETMA